MAGVTFGCVGLVVECPRASQGLVTMLGRFFVREVPTLNVADSTESGLGKLVVLVVAVS